MQIRNLHADTLKNFDSVEPAVKYDVKVVCNWGALSGGRRIQLFDVKF